MYSNRLLDIYLIKVPQYFEFLFAYTRLCLLGKILISKFQSLPKTRKIICLYRIEFKYQ